MGEDEHARGEATVFSGAEPIQVTSDDLLDLVRFQIPSSAKHVGDRPQAAFTVAVRRRCWASTST